MALLFGLDTVELAAVVFATGSAAVGLYIAGQAYRGVRRYESRQMLYLSVGMILVFGVAYLVGFVGTAALQLRVLPLPYQDLFRLMIRVIQFAGLLAIAYSLYLRE